MSDLTPEKLAELRRLLDEAPPLPYRDSPATHGDPSNGPTYVALEAQWEGRWEEVATGNYERWCGMGIALAAAAVNALPALLDAAENQDILIGSANHYKTERDALAAKLTHMTEARDHDWAEVERLAAQVDAVRAWIDRRGVNVDDRDDEYMRGYRDAQRHARLDALELRRALDGEVDRD